MNIEYDGTQICGWQTQKNGRTVQEDIEKVLQLILQEEIRITGAGRTDAGVHAQGQVASFFVSKEIDELKLVRSLNALLKRDIAIRSVARAEDGFHARFSAIYRQYHYSISLEKPAIHRHFTWFMPCRCNWQTVQSVMPKALGKHDFSAFCAAGSAAKTRDCNVHFFSLEEKGNEIVFHIRANRFLYRMVRSLVGTLVDIGKGKLPPEYFAKAIASGDKKYAGTTAPASGLTLTEVGYGTEPEERNVH